MFSCVMFNLQFVQLKVCSIVVCSMLTCSLFNRLCVQLTFVQMLKVQYDFCSIIQMLSYSTFKLLMFNWPFVQLTSCSVVFWSSRICSIIFLFNCFVQKDLFIRPLFNRPGRQNITSFPHLSVFLSAMSKRYLTSASPIFIPLERMKSAYSL